MKIDDHTVPDIVVDALCSLADRVDAAHILEQAVLTPSLFQGHRAIKQNVNVARQHIKLALKSDRSLDPANATILRKAGLQIDVVIVLSETALAASFAEMTTYFGEADFIAATLLDERESVRELAHDFLRTWDGNQSDESRREMAAKELRSTFSSFLLRIKELIDETLPPPSRSDSETKAISGGKPDKSHEAAKAELARLTKQSVSDKKQLQARLDERQAEIDRLQIDLTARLNNHNSFKRELAEAKSELSEIKSTLQQQIAEGVKAALTNKLRGWLEPGIQINEGLENAHKSNLIDRAKEALEKQRSTDLHFGNREELSRLLEQRRQLLADINRARATAMHPLPELKSIAAELEKETHEIQQRLGVGDKKVDPTVSGLLTNINAAQFLDELAAVRRFIQQAATYSLLSRDNLQSLYRAMDNKAGMIYDKTEIVGDPAPNHPSKRFFLRHAVAKGQPFTLFIDGHNVLYQLEDIFGRYFDNGHPESKARVELADRLTRIFINPGSNVLLYFDGSEAKQQSLSDQVRVFYSGGSGEHRADEAILNHLMQFVRSEPSTPLCLVTKDADFARHASDLGVTILHPEEFAEALDLGA